MVSPARTFCNALMRSVLIPAGYVEVKAPIVFNKALWETSGHWQHYRQNMFLVETEGEQQLEGRQRGAYPRVVRNASVLERDIQVAADENALVGGVGVADGAGALHSAGA